jgi:hypothetical protein
MKKLVAFVLLVAGFAWAQSPLDGTWKVNLTNAQFTQKPLTFVLQKDRYSCTDCSIKVDVRADGSDQKVPEAKSYDTLAVKQLDERTVQFTRKKAGKVVYESTDTVSPDGKTLTEEFKEYPPQGQPVTGKVALTRVADGPQGGHALSGSWRVQKVENVSEQGLTFTLKSTADGLSMSTPTGESYDAKFDGKDYPVKGDRAGGVVSLKKINDTTFEETYKQDGKPVQSSQFSVQGKTLKVDLKNLRRGTTESFTAEKQ